MSILVKTSFSATDLTYKSFSSFAPSDFAPFCQQVMEIDCVSIRYHWNLSQWNSFFQSFENRALLSLLVSNSEKQADTEVAAFALFGLNPWQSQAHLLKIAVRPQLQRQGLARKLMEDAIDDLKRLDHQEIYLEVASSNLAALDFYSSHDFRHIDTRKGFYSDGEDAQIFILKL